MATGSPWPPVWGPPVTECRGDRGSPLHARFREKLRGNKTQTEAQRQRVRFGEEEQGSGADGGRQAAGAKADFATTSTPAGDRGSPLHRAIDLHPVGACFARPWATAGRPYMPDSGRSCGETKPKPKPSASGFGLERRSKEAARMAATRPPERKRTLRRRARRRATAGRPCVPNSGDS